MKFLILFPQFCIIFILDEFDLVKSINSVLVLVGNDGDSQYSAATKICFDVIYDASPLDHEISIIEIFFCFCFNIIFHTRRNSVTLKGSYLSFSINTPRYRKGNSQLFMYFSISEKKGE